MPGRGVLPLAGPRRGRPLRRGPGYWAARKVLISSGHRLGLGPDAGSGPRPAGQFRGVGHSSGDPRAASALAGSLRGFRRSETKGQHGQTVGIAESPAGRRRCSRSGPSHRQQPGLPKFQMVIRRMRSRSAGVYPSPSRLDRRRGTWVPAQRTTPVTASSAQSTPPDCTSPGAARRLRRRDVDPDHGRDFRRVAVGVVQHVEACDECPPGRRAEGREPSQHFVEFGADVLDAPFAGAHVAVAVAESLHDGRRRNHSSPGSAARSRAPARGCPRPLRSTIDSAGWPLRYTLTAPPAISIRSP